MLATILLDLDGVLKIPDAHWIVSTLDELGFAVTLGQAESAHYEGIRRFDESAQQPLRKDYEQCYPEGVRIALGVPAIEWPLLMPYLLVGVAFQHSILAPGSLDVMRAWAAAGLELVVITQNQRPGAGAWLAHQGLGRVDSDGPLAVVAESSVVGVSKPDPQLAQYALTRLGRNADEAVYIGDSLRLDAPTAAGAGVPCIHMTALGDCRCAYPHVRTLSHDDLPVEF